MKKKLFLCLGIILFIIPAFSGESFSLENDGGRVSIYTLENGMSVFVMQDSSSAVSSMELAVKAGYSSQTAANAGFAPLYVRLLRGSGEGVTASCNTESATYSLSSSPSQTEEALEKLFKTVTEPYFTNEYIEITYNNLRDELTAYEKTATALINSTIDSRVFSEAPWKQDSGAYPALFASYSPEEIRTQILMFRDQLYVPSNSALFVTTPLAPSAVISMVKNTFGLWQGEQKKKAEETKLIPEQKRKFVIADDAFSKDLTQLVVQFVTLTSSEADCLSAAFNSVSSPYTKPLLSQPLLALRSADYLACSSAQRSDSSRLILQALMEKPYSLSQTDDAEDASVAQQADMFVQSAKSAAGLTRREFVQAQSAVQAQYKSSMANSVKAMQFLCDFWAHDSSYGTDGFYSRFLDRKTASFTLSEKKLALDFQKEEPFVFAMVNTETYQAQKKEFEEDGWTLVTRENAAWYKNEELAQKALAVKDAQNTEALDATARTYFADEELTDAQRYYALNAELFFTGTLANGIPITLKETPHSQTVLFSLAIQGGELASPQGELFLRTILVNAFATNINAEISALSQQNAFSSQPQIKAYTQEAVSYITVECQKEDLMSALTAASNAVIFGEITPVVADYLVYEQKGEWGTKTQDITYQLWANAVREIFKGTPYESIYGTNHKVLSNTAFNSVALAYTKLLDAALYSIVMVGDIDEADALKAAEETFGKLKEQTVRKAYPAVPEPSFSSGVTFVQLSHTFMTDMPAELASPESPLLIPTKEFSDPVVALFATPSLNSERQILNALLYNLAYRMQKKLPVGTSCTSTGASGQLHVASIQADSILHTEDFDNAYRQARAELIKELSAEDGNISLTKKILSDWIVKELSDTLTNEGTAALIQEGLRSGNATQYLSDFLFMETLEAQDLLFYAQELLPEFPFTAYSADSQK